MWKVSQRQVSKFKDQVTRADADSKNERPQCIYSV